MQPSVVDVSGITGQRVAGRVTSWQTRNGPYNVEHLAGRNPAGDLIVFWWSPQHDWQAVNVSQKAGQKIAGDVTSWQTQNGPYNVEHLAARNPAGELIVFWWSPQHDWQAVNVSAKTGQKIDGAPTSWQTRNGPYNVEHLAGRNPAGYLIVFWWSPQHDWQAVNVSQRAGQKIAGDVTSWQTRNGPYNVEHLAGRNPAGELIVFWWSPQHDWQAIDASRIAGGTIAGRPASFQVRDVDGNAEMLAATGTSNSLLYYWWKPGFDWEMADLSDLTGRKVHTDPEAWTTSSGDHVVEHLACEGDRNMLLVFWFDAEIRYEGMSTDRWVRVGPRNFTCVVLALAVHPADPQTVWAGAEFGGVWKSSNGGRAWTPTMNGLVNPCVNALAVSPTQPSIVYAGMSPGKVGENGVTLYRSSDGGTHWAPRTSVASTFCHALALHPTNPEILYYAGDQALYKTTDAGATWSDVLAGNIDDVKVALDSPETLYASVRGRGIFKSTDGGSQWNQKAAGVTFDVLDDNQNVVQAGSTEAFERCWRSATITDRANTDPASSSRRSKGRSSSPSTAATTGARYRATITVTTIRTGGTPA